LATLDAIEAAPPGTAPPSEPERRKLLPEDGGGGDGYDAGTPSYDGPGFMSSVANGLGWAVDALDAYGYGPNPPGFQAPVEDRMTGETTAGVIVGGPIDSGNAVGVGVGPEVGESVSGDYTSGAYTSSVSPGNAVGVDVGSTGGGFGTGDGFGNSDMGANFARGGPVTADRLTGPNPRGPDDGYGALDAGEYVMRSSAVQRYGQEAMQALNEGRASITMNEGGPGADVQQLARMGRGGDTELVHMTKNEVAGMQDVAEQYGGSLTRNPETGLQEAWILQALGIGASLYSASRGRKQAGELAQQAREADTWGQSGGRAMAGQQLQQLMQDPGQASANDPGYRMRIQGAQRAMAPMGQDSGAMAVAAAGASSDWYNQRLQQLGTLAGAPGQPGIALQGQEAANELYGRSLGNLSYGMRQFGDLVSNPGAGSGANFNTGESVSGYYGGGGGGFWGNFGRRG